MGVVAFADMIDICKLDALVFILACEREWNEIGTQNLIQIKND